MGGLAKFDQSTWEIFTSDNSELPGDFINSVAIDKNNNKILGVFQRGLVLYNESGVNL